MWGNLQQGLRGWGYIEIQEGRWCPAIDLALVCNSTAPVNRSESSPELWKMASLVPRPRVNGLLRSLPREELSTDSSPGITAMKVGAELVKMVIVLPKS